MDGFALGTPDTSIDFGSFTVNLSRPTATITPNSVKSLSAPDCTFSVVYDGQAAPITSYPTTLNITGPSASASMSANVSSETVQGNKTTVTYTAPKPASGWKGGREVYDQHRGRCSLQQW